MISELSTSSVSVWLAVPAGIWALLAGALGLTLGSFFNVVVYRVPLGKSVVSPPSACPSCGNFIAWYDNVPVLSWLLLRGKCRHCGLGISIQYPLIELGTGLATAAAVLLTAQGWGGAGWLDGAALRTLRVVDPGLTVALVLLVLATFPVVVTDLRSFLIPDVVVLPGAVLGLAASFLPGGVAPVQSLIGAAAPAFGLWLFAKLISRVLGREAMGFGDVKLVAFFGALLGPWGALLSIVFGSLLGTLVIAPLQALGKREKGAELPFGPFLYLGAYVAFAFGRSLWNWYLGGA
jgi:leader peptidase (prepilin peptidase)/N-methyltransferase